MSVDWSVTMKRLALLVPAVAISTWGAPTPPWRMPECNSRAVFELPERESRAVVVSIPNEEGLTTDSRFAACDAAGRNLPCRVVHVDHERAYVVICVPSRESNTGFLYYSAEPAGQAGTTAPVCHDPAPVLVEVQRAGGKSAPNSWEKMLFLYTSGNHGRQAVTRPYFDDIPYVPYGEERRPEERARSIVIRFRTIFQAVEGGEYRFAIDCRDAGFLLVDGEHAAEWPGEHPPGQWQIGRILFLRAGPHVLDFYNCLTTRMPPRLGWIPPGREKVEPIPREALLTTEMVEPLRIERKDRSLHVGFAWNVLSAYSFRGLPHVFIPVKFRNATKNWITEAMSAVWFFNNSGPVNEKDPVHIFRTPTIHTATLVVKDQLGFSGSTTGRIDCRHVCPRQYLVSCEVTELPATCYPSDIVTPTLRVSGFLPEGLRLSVAWEIERRSEETEKFETVVTPRVGPSRVAMTTVAAGKLSRLVWYVRHAGVDLFSGRILFLRPDFDRIPVKVETDRLYDAEGNQVVLVPHEMGGRFVQPANRKENLRTGILCVDDFLDIPLVTHTDSGDFLRQALRNNLGRLASPTIRHVRLGPGNSQDTVFDPLLPLVEVPRIVQESGCHIVVLSLGLTAWLNGLGIERFERQAAALSDLLSGTMKKFVVWVTPPPYLSDPNRARGFSTAIRRVADARGIPVADLYSGILGTENQQELFLRGQDLVLSRKGQELAGRLMARALSSQMSY
ncbi:MAG: hypothetical protein N2255_00755 [Kiritimatiellae bacterium]|nr:hypothetical protein [Kiritimatiellia bacterium]